MSNNVTSISEHQDYIKHKRMIDGDFLLEVIARSVEKMPDGEGRSALASFYIFLDMHIEKIHGEAE